MKCASQWEHFLWPGNLHKRKIKCFITLNFTVAFHSFAFWHWSRDYETKKWLPFQVTHVYYIPYL